MIKNGVCDQAYSSPDVALVYCDRGDTHYPGDAHRGYSAEYAYDIEWVTDSPGHPWHRTVNASGEVVRG